MGAPQWTVPIWKGRVYAKGTPQSDFLEAYARQWNAIELNSSFYSSPSASQVLAWAERTPKDFRFFVKVHQDLSHDRDLYANPEIFRAKIHSFQATWKNLSERWGGTFLQLPPYFSASDLPKLRSWIAAWKNVSSERPGEKSLLGIDRLSIEFRHESFFINRRLISAAEALLVEQGISAVCTDTPGRRDASHSTLTTDFWMVRFLAQSTEKNETILGDDLGRLETWALRLSELTKRGLRGFAFFPHTPEHRWVPELSIHFLKFFREKLAEESELSRSLQAPTLLPEKPDQLGFSL